MTLTTLNAPAFTTATACSNALTGVGATMAAGSHRWEGMRATFPMPNTYNMRSTPTIGPVSLPARMPPGANSTVPATTQVPDDREEQQTDRGREENPQVYTAGPHRLLASAVCDEGVRGKRQELVENEQGEEVAREGDPHGAAESQREADIEAGLIRLPVPPHVPDRVERVDRPEEGRKPSENHSQRLELEAERETGHHLHQSYLWTATREHLGEQGSHHEEEESGRDHGDRVARVRPPPRQADEQRACGRDGRCEQEGSLGAHAAAPVSRRAITVPPLATIRLRAQPRRQ